MACAAAAPPWAEPACGPACAAAAPLWVGPACGPACAPAPSPCAGLAWGAPCAAAPPACVPPAWGAPCAAAAPRSATMCRLPSSAARSAVAAAPDAIDARLSVNVAPTIGDANASAMAILRTGIMYEFLLPKASATGQCGRIFRVRAPATWAPRDKGQLLRPCNIEGFNRLFRAPLEPWLAMPFGRQQRIGCTTSSACDRPRSPPCRRHRPSRSIRW
jgi:hypothetical protein